MPMFKVIIWLTFILAVFGLVMISSAGIYLSQKNFGTSYHYFTHQLVFGFLFGSILFFAGLKINYKFWRKLALPLILLALFLLVLIFVPGFGVSVGGAKRWLNFFGLFSFQPTEILKLALIIYLASWLNGRKFSFGSVAAFAVIIFLIGLFIAAQPATGTLIIIVAIALAMFFVSGGSFKHFMAIILLMAVSLALLIFLSPYRFERLFVFLNPDFDVRGIGYHLNQSLIAIGKGGVWGLGFGAGEQKLGFLPESASDSIFAVIGEELGFIGMLATVSTLLAFVLVLLRIAKKTSDKFVSLYAVGLASWVGTQSFLNIASLSGLLPLTGVPLPFISFGGTSLAVLMLATGILGNMTKK